MAAEARSDRGTICLGRIETRALKIHPQIVTKSLTSHRRTES